MRRLAPLLVALMTGVSAQNAHAATVEVTGAVGPVVRYVASPGERNDLSFVEIEDSWPTAFLVVDPGATVQAGRGCVPVDAHSAACISRSGSMYHLRASLGDGDDVLHPAGSSHIRADGGPGDDRLLGGSSDDRLNGGGGTDEVRGGLGADVLLDGDPDGAADADVLDGGGGDDWVSYELRTEGVSVDLSDPGPNGAPGEGDVLLGVENARGGRGDDRLTGDDRPNQLVGQGGEDVVVAGGGADAVSGVRSGRVDCGDGIDVLRAVTARTHLGQSCEYLLRAWEDEDFRVRVHPQRTASGLSLFMECDEYDGEPITCSGRVRIRTGATLLATGVIPPGSGRRLARLRLTAAGTRLLSRRRVAATIELQGTGLPDLAWSLTMPPPGVRN